MQGRRKLFGILESFIRALGQRFSDDGIEGRRNLNVKFGRCDRVFLEHLMHDGCQLAGERLLAGQELIEDDASREEIGAPVDGLPHELFG